MKLAVLMWVLTLSDLSGEIRVYEGTLNECLLNAIIYNENHKNKKYAGCFALAKQYSYVLRE
jgi:hypothetical protein|tara:strand:- start:619 stop:804 length:186 start_codon:yes stop_codon:yes gene_type:complete